MLLFPFYFVLVFVNVHGFLRCSKRMSFLNKTTGYVYNSKNDFKKNKGIKKKIVNKCVRQINVKFER